MNILGEGFPPEIINQVKQRQKIYASGYDNNSRTPDEIIYLNANTAWCKLVSATDVSNINIINNESIKRLNLTGDALAKQFILFNGTYISGSDQRSGIDITNSLLGENNAYGIGGTEFGIRPMMGIESANISHKNRGSIRTAVVKIKAWNKIQFEIIDVLYLRLGFTVLLEWGNSMYYTSPSKNNSQPEFISNPIDNTLAYEFLDGKGNYKSFLKKIQDKRIKTYGNYDAMFAKVTNFHWSFKPDGSYDITLNLVSVGDVVESFKIKGNAPSSPDKTGYTQGQELSFEQELALFAQNNDLAKYLYNCLITLNSDKNVGYSGYNGFFYATGKPYLYNTAYNTDWDKYWDDPNGTFAKAVASGNAIKDICRVYTKEEDPVPTGPTITLSDGTVIPSLGTFTYYTDPQNTTTTPATPTSPGNFPTSTPTVPDANSFITLPDGTVIPSQGTFIVD